MGEHAPGPWFAEDDGTVWFDGREQVCCGKGYSECCGNPDIIGGQEVVVNASPKDARLIAAAPEMYAVLVMVRDADDDCLRDGLASLPRMARAKLEEAIRKAETGHA